MSAAQYRDTTRLPSDTEHIRSFVLHAVSCWELSRCATTPRTQDGEHFTTGCSPSRLYLGIDAGRMFARLGKARKRRLWDWAVGALPLNLLPRNEYAMLKEDLSRIRRMAVSGGYGHLVGDRSRIG